MLNIKVRIRTIDPYGYNGREHHPSSDMVGMIATVLSIESIDAEGEPLRDPLAVLRVPQDEAMCVYECVTDDGRVVTLMSHEVEPWSISSEPVRTGEIPYRHAAAYNAAVHAPVPTPATVRRIIPIR